MTATIKKLAVMSIAVFTLQADVIQTHQDHTEPDPHFAAIEEKVINGKFQKFVKFARAGCEQSNAVRPCKKKKCNSILTI